MKGFDPARLREVVDELASALQVVVLTAEELERSSAAAVRDAKVLLEHLHRVTEALHRLHGDRLL